ncbi:MAG: DUF58 domain-containing protein [Ardenticatenaceae bacterium]|nr:DUF58 domain-containing protein [Ardenticatenaceae bacterium]
MPIFDETTLRQLEQLTLTADQVRAGRMKGDRRSSKRGTSIEFADYRNYVQGDDLRRLDWNVYARLERPFIKLLEEEEDLSVHLLVDVSKSMDWPEADQPEHKLTYAMRLAAGLGHIALTAGDQLSVTLLRSDEDRRWGPFRGAISSLPLFQFLEAGEDAAGITDLNISLNSFALRSRRPGLLLLLSDLMSPNGYQDGLAALQNRGFEVSLLHLLSPDEIEPGLIGDVKLIDAETAAEAEVTLDAATLDAYRQRVSEWQSEINHFCGSRGIDYVPVVTSSPWEQLVLRTMREMGMVK